MGKIDELRSHQCLCASVDVKEIGLVKTTPVTRARRAAIDQSTEVCCCSRLATQRHGAI